MKKILPLSIILLLFFGGRSFALQCAANERLEQEQVSIDSDNNGSIDSTQFLEKCLLVQSDDPGTLIFYEALIFWCMRSIQSTSPLYLVLIACGVFRRMALAKFR
jgi:hypothetical protein